MYIRNDVGEVHLLLAWKQFTVKQLNLVQRTWDRCLNCGQVGCPLSFDCLLIGH
jgi:hypothetical protein